jgi:YbgC/YbaW family acyl-CoA thioester hydrolase
MEPIEFNTTHISNFRHLDPFGHMNHTHYLDFFMDHRFEGLRKMGWTLSEIAKLPFIFPITKIELEFIAPISSDSTFTISSKIPEFAEKSCVVDGVFLSSTGSVLARIKQFYICLDKKTLRPIPWPESFTKNFFKE